MHHDLLVAPGLKLSEPVGQRFDGDQLVINYSTSAAGIVQVELQDLDKPLPDYELAKCKPVIGDEIERVVA